MNRQLSTCSPGATWIVCVATSCKEEKRRGEVSGWVLLWRAPNSACTTSIASKRLNSGNGPTRQHGEPTGTALTLGNLVLYRIGVECYSLTKVYCLPKWLQAARRAGKPCRLARYGRNSAVTHHAIVSAWCRNAAHTSYRPYVVDTLLNAQLDAPMQSSLCIDA